MSVTLTDAAARHVTRYMTKRGKGVGVRLGVKTTGCSGLAYKLEYADEIAPEDVVFEDNGVTVLVDPKSMAYIDGTQLDFVREGLNEGFKFLNPNERDRCGSQKFSQDRAAIDARWKQLQKEAHPDKFAVQGVSAQRVAMQWSVRINEAYQRLKDPLRRAAYLCELHGAVVNAENNTAMPASFLMQQIEWREALDEAKTAESIHQISDLTNEFMRDQLSKI
eukprot:gene55957-74713_t